MTDRKPSAADMKNPGPYENAFLSRRQSNLRISFHSDPEATVALLFYNRDGVNHIFCNILETQSFTVPDIGCDQYY